MRLQILGKIVLVLTIGAISLFAGVTASISPRAVYKGDSAQLTITADGEDVVFPEIDEIDGVAVNGTSTSRSTSIINGNVSHKVSKIYTFTPQKSLKIPSYKVFVDGKEEKTQELTLKVLKPTAGKSGDDFILSMSVDKNEASVGEAIDLTLTFKQKVGAKASNIELGEPKLEDFWVKKVGDVQKSEENGYIVQRLHYLLFPQKSGEYSIPAIRANVGVLVQNKRRFGGGMFNDPFFDDPFFSRLSRDIKWKRIYSNDIKLHIKPLPNGLELFGNFEISASVDKTKVQANKPVNLTITVKGVGNIDDVKKFELNIPDAVVYADEPKITPKLQNGEYGGEFTQKIAIVADRNYTIPEVELEFVDSKTKEPKTVSTKPIDIEVTGGASVTSKVPATPLIEKAKTPQNTTKDDAKESVSTKTVVENGEASYIKYLYLLLGLIIGVVGTYLVSGRKPRSKKELPIVQKIHKAKSDRELFDLLLPYAKESKTVEKTLSLLEENLYKGAKHKIDKQPLIDYFFEATAL